MKITTKHARNSPVTFVTHKRFAVVFFLPSCCLNWGPKGEKIFFGDRPPPKLFKGLDDRALPYLKVWIQHWLESSNTVRSLLKEIWRGKIPFLHFIANSIPGGAKICSDAEERKGDLEFQESEIIWCSGGLYGSLLPSPPSLVFSVTPLPITLCVHSTVSYTCSYDQFERKRSCWFFVLSEA